MNHKDLVRKNGSLCHFVESMIATDFLSVCDINEVRLLDLDSESRFDL